MDASMNFVASRALLDKPFSMTRISATICGHACSQWVYTMAKTVGLPARSPRRSGFPACVVQADST